MPALVSAYRPGEPTDFSSKLSQAAIERTKHIDYQVSGHCRYYGTLK
jgi:hypothetical protein